MANTINSLVSSAYIKSSQLVNSEPKQSSSVNINENDSFSASESFDKLPKMPTALKSAASAERSSKADPVKITIISTNDMHGKLDRMPKMAAVIKVLQQQHPDAILVDGGDSSYNPPYSTNNKYKPIASVMDAINYDIINLGNHEFQFGKGTTIKEFVNIVADEDTDVLAANVHDKSIPDPLEGTKPYVVKDVNGIKVAFIGLVEPNMGTSANPHVGTDLVKETPVQCLNRLMPEMQKQADIVIAMTHQGIGDDQRMLRLVAGIDLVLASHDHAVTDQALQVGSFPNQTYIVEGGSHCRLVSLVELSVDPKSKEVVGINIKNYPVETFNVQPDAGIAKIISDYEKNSRR